MAENGQAGAALAKRDATGDQLMRTGETAAMAQAAHAEALVRARYTMALSRPRDWNEVRERALRECQRPRFAAVSRYSVPRGREKDETGKWVDKYIEGWSIRAAEALHRLVGNIDVTVRVIADDARQRVISVLVTDLESNASNGTEITVTKTMERRKLKDGQTAIGQRTNSYGDTVFIVETTDDELMVKQGALVSKARRNLILQLVPGDLLDEMLEQVQATLKDEDAKDPDAIRKRVLDGFAGVGVKARDLGEYVRQRWSKELDAITPADARELHKVYVAMRDGDTTWPEVLAGVVAPEERPAAPAGAAPKTTADLKAREKSREKARGAATPASPAPPADGMPDHGNEPEPPMPAEPGSDG